MSEIVRAQRKKSYGKQFAKFKREIPLHIMLIPSIVIVFIYHYLPMFGIIMAFQRFNPILSFWSSPFIGLKNFVDILSMKDFWRAFNNSFIIAFLKIICGLSVPLLMALLINEIRWNKFKRTVQTSIFLPYFLSWTVLGGVVQQIFALDGPINTIIRNTGGEEIMFLASNSWFRFILVFTDVWKGMGYNIIIFLAAITSIDPALYEAAQIDGGNRLRQSWHITLPGMRPIIILVATLAIGGLLNAGFEQIFILYSPSVYQSADILDTLVYRLGLINSRLAPAAAVGLFKSALSLVLVGIAYYSAYKFSDYRIF
ncbi:MAG: sugar ABC transporter permease [Oscillospiraceae bacterium]|nr:sugar ABC transporter permease [Oscillospiraceae bacterium]